MMGNFIKSLVRRELPLFRAQAASFDWPAFVRRCLNSSQPFNDALTPYDVTVSRVNPSGGQFWRCLGVYHLNGVENRRNHHLYVDVLDKNGNRIFGAKVVARNVNDEIKSAVIDKPREEAGTNIPLWANDRVDLSVDYLDLPSDTINNLATRPEIPGVIWPDDPGNSQSHNSFGIVFQLADAGGTVDPGPPPPPPPPTDPTVPGDWLIWKEHIEAEQSRQAAAIEQIKANLRKAGQ